MTIVVHITEKRHMRVMSDSWFSRMIKEYVQFVVFSTILKRFCSEMNQRFG